MGSLKDSNPNSEEVLTQILDEESSWSAIDVLVEFLVSRNIEKAHAKFGFILSRDLRGEAQPEDQIIEVAKLKAFIETALADEIIEWKGQSDFILEGIGIDLRFMLCNDADLHFASADETLLLELGNAMTAIAIKVYRDGRPI